MGFEPATSDFVDLSLITYCRPTAALNSNYKFVITFFIMARLIRYYTYNSQHRCVHRVPDATSAAKRRCGEQARGDSPLLPGGHWQRNRPFSSARHVPLWQGEEAQAEPGAAGAQRQAPPSSTHSWRGGQAAPGARQSPASSHVGPAQPPRHSQSPASRHAPPLAQRAQPSGADAVSQRGPPHPASQSQRKPTAYGHAITH